MKKLGRMLAIGIAVVILLPLLLGAAALALAQTDFGRAEFARLIEHMASTPEARIEIGAIEGTVPFDMTVRNVTLSDADGTWATMDRGRFAWHPSALLSGTLSIEAIDLGRIALARPPHGQSTSQTGWSGILKNIPLRVALDRLSIDELDLAKPVIGTPARLTAKGHAYIGPPNQGLGARLTVDRLDAKGGISLDLSYVPDTQELTTKLKVNEPAGGLVSRFAGIEGLPPIDLTLDGDGTLDNWSATLKLAAGDKTGADGHARITRHKDGREIGLDLEGNIAALMPAAYAPLAEGTTHIQAKAFARDDGIMIVRRLDVDSAGADLLVAGNIALRTRQAHLTVSLNAGDAERFAGLLPSRARWRTLSLNARISGPLSQAVVHVTLDARDVTGAQGRIGHLSMRATAKPAGPYSDPAAQIAVTMNGQAERVAPAGVTPATASGDTVSWQFEGTATPARTIDIVQSRITLPGAVARYAGKISPAGLDGTLQLDSSDLSRLSGFTGRPVKGQIELGAKVFSDFDGSKLALRLNGRGKNLVIGNDRIDRLLGGRLSISGGLSRGADGSFAFNDLVLAGTNVEITANGSADPKAVDVKAKVSLPDLNAVDPRITGRADIDAVLGGTLHGMTANGTVSLTKATALGRPLEALKLQIDAKGLTGSPSGTLSLSGTADGKPVEGSGKLTSSDDGTMRVDDLALGVGSVRLAGAIAVDTQNHVTGRITLDAGNLADISTFALTELGGSLHTELVATMLNGKQVVDIDAKGSDLAAARIKLTSFLATAHIVDPLGTLSADADVAAQDIVAGGNRIDSVNLTATGGLDTTHLTLAAKGFATKAKAEADLAMKGGAILLDLESLTASHKGQSVKLAAPSHIAVHDGVATVDKLALQASGGTLLLAGKAGASVLDMKIDIAKLPLSIASFVKPGLELAGTLSARASISGTPAAPRGRYDVSIGGLETAQTRNAAFGAFRVSAEGTLNGKTTAVRMTVDGPRNARLTVSGTAPLSTSGSLSLAVNGKLDLSMLNNFLATTGDSVSGPVTVDLRLTGPATAPSAQGTIRVAGAAYDNRAAGLRLDDINATLTGSTKALEISSLSARTQNGGTITGSGRIILDPSAGFPGTLKLKAANAQLVATDIVTATADLDLTIDGALMKKPTVGGKISVRTMEVDVPNRLPARTATIDVKHVNAPPRVRKQLAREAAKTAAKEARKMAAFEAALDITVLAPNRVFIRGRGIDAEVGGQIKVTGTTGNPQAVGTFTMRRGTFTMLTQRLTFTRGNLTFAGGLDPVLDMLAETQADGITAQVSITGRASNPKFDFSSVPSLPRDEVLSRLLFKKASGQLSPFEAVQLARAVAQLTGLGGGGGGVLEEIRKSLGLDALDITNNAAGGPAVGVGRYINDRIYLGVQQGAQAGSSRVTVNVDVTKHIKVQGQVAPDGESKAGVAVEWNY